MPLALDVAAVRTSVGLGDADHLVCVRVAGREAHTLLDRVSPRELFLRSGQMLHTLLLDDYGTPLADVYLCCDDDYYCIVADGMSGQALTAYLERHGRGLDASVVDLSAAHGFLSLDGPFAWELLADVTTPDVIGLPYLGFFHEDRFTCFRAGSAGEYGYYLLVEHARRAALRERFLEAGRRFELRRVSREALDLCALEAGFFNVRRAVRSGLTPVELQLSWRVNAGRSFPGSEVLAERRDAPRGRVALVAAAEEIGADATVALDGSDVGVVLHAGRSYTRGEWLAVALLDCAVSHSGLSGFTSQGRALRTISAPAVNNRSLYVDPQRHSYATRASESFPPLVRPWWS